MQLYCIMNLKLTQFKQTFKVVCVESHITCVRPLSNHDYHCGTTVDGRFIVHRAETLSGLDNRLMNDVIDFPSHAIKI